jgi:DNA-binding XRE family transcriptional regulator
MARLKTRETIAEILHPIRHNDLEARRRRLKLSRVALARILDVDPATVYRQERGVMSALWNYALRGVEAEASSPNRICKATRRTSIVAISSQTLWSGATAIPGKR